MPLALPASIPHIPGFSEIKKKIYIFPVPSSQPAQNAAEIVEKQRRQNEVEKTAQTLPQPTSLDLTATVDAVDFAAETLGPFGQLLKNATRCNLKMNCEREKKIFFNQKFISANATKRPVLNGTENTTAASSTTAESMVVSMELNGVLYQGVLFAIPTNVEAQNGTVNEAERQAQNSPQQQQAVHATEEQ